MSLIESDKHMIHCACGPALHSPVAPKAACIISSHTGDRGRRSNAKYRDFIGANWISTVHDKSDYVATNVMINART